MDILQEEQNLYDIIKEFQGNQIVISDSINKPLNSDAKQMWKSIFSKKSETTTKSSQGKKATSLGSSVPYEKRVPGTTFVVDAFKYGSIENCNGYFLSHFHADHYDGLTRKFQGKLYCSETTGKLVVQELKVSSEFIKVLPLDQTVRIDDVEVILIDANHCPGSVMFIFTLPDGKRILHTGDCRLSKNVTENPLFHREPFLDTIYLDTTFCDEKFSFPAQEDIISQVCSEISNVVNNETNEKYLIAVGTYKIGKERIVLGIARALNCSIYVTEQKKKIYDCMDYDELHELIVSDPKNAKVHVIFLNNINSQNCSNYIDELYPTFTRLIVVKPTGWQYDQKSEIVKTTFLSYIGTIDKLAVNARNVIRMISVAYSEHSSYKELEEFVQRVPFRRLVPTVAGPSGYKSVGSILKKWKTVKFGEK